MPRGSRRVGVDGGEFMLNTDSRVFGIQALISLIPNGRRGCYPTKVRLYINMTH